MNTVDALKKLYKTMAGKDWAYDPNPTDAEVIDKIADDTPEGGGGGATVPENDVTLRDYDGSVIASYTADEFLALSAMPDAPTHEGLVSQGWNYSLEKAKEYVTKYGKLNVGQMYITDDGTTRIYINVDNNRLSPVLALAVNGTVDVDWGDGTEHETLAGSSLTNPVQSQPHTYVQTGEYVIKLRVEGNAALDVSTCFFNRPALVKKIELGNNINIGGNAFSNCYSLSSITIPDGVTSIGGNAFAGCYSLSSITIPDSVTSIGDYAFNNCHSLSSITIPDGVTSIGGNAFNNCYSLSSITIPDGVTSIGGNAFAGCSNLVSITIPDGVTSIGEYAFAVCSNLVNITIPRSVTSIRDGAFLSCDNLVDYHLKPATPPSIGSGALTVTDQTIIYVPYSADHSVLNAYKSATNWSSYALYIREEEAA